MTTLTEQLNTEIDAFLTRTGMAPSMFGLKSCGDKHVVRRLRMGRSVTLRTADHIRKFMQDYSPASGKQRPKFRAAGAAA